MSTQDLVLYILAIVGFLIATYGAWTYSRNGHLTAFGWLALALTILAYLI